MHSSARSGGNSRSARTSIVDSNENSAAGWSKSDNLFREIPPPSTVDCEPLEFNAASIDNSKRSCTNAALLAFCVLRVPSCELGRGGANFVVLQDLARFVHGKGSANASNLDL